MILYQRGEEMAFEVLFERHSGRVLQFLTGKLQNREFAQDVTQQVFLRLHRSREQYSAQFPFLPWLFTIAKTAMMDAMKETTALKRVDASKEYVELIATPSLVSEPAVLDHFHLLPSAQKDALTLRFLKDSSFEEIARHLNTSESNARQLVSRGIKRLKKILTPSDGGES